MELLQYGTWSRSTAEPGAAPLRDVRFVASLLSATLQITPNFSPSSLLGLPMENLPPSPMPLRQFLNIVVPDVSARPRSPSRGRRGKAPHRPRGDSTSSGTSTSSSSLNGPPTSSAPKEKEQKTPAPVYMDDDDDDDVRKTIGEIPIHEPFSLRGTRIDMSHLTDFILDSDHR